jgi:3-phenylpropionate/trans-cinnamate dioxygenase ferredoxin reductase subunit
VGLSQGYDSVVIRGDPAERAFSCCYLRDGELIALDAVNHVKDFMAARKLVGEHVKPDPVRLADPALAIKDTF